MTNMRPKYQRSRNLSDCEQLVRCSTKIAGNRVDLVMTDVPDVVDVHVCSILGTSEHGIVSCVLRVEQSVLEYNMRSAVFLKHRTNWDNARWAVKSFCLEAPFQNQQIH